MRILIRKAELRKENNRGALVLRESGKAIPKPRKPKKAKLQQTGINKMNVKGDLADLWKTEE